MYERSKNSYPSEKPPPIYYDFFQYMSYCGLLRIRYAALKTKKTQLSMKRQLCLGEYLLNEIDRIGGPISQWTMRQNDDVSGYWGP